jgi:hypothetical protein
MLGWMGRMRAHLDFLGTTKAKENRATGRELTAAASGERAMAGIRKIRRRRCVGSRISFRDTAVEADLAHRIKSCGSQAVGLFF